MKSWKIALMFVLGTMTGCDAEDRKPAATRAQAQAPLSAAQVVDRHLAALGGVDRLRAVKSLVTRGEYIEGAEVDTFVAYRARPNLLRKEGTHQGKPFTKLFDGERGYMAEGEQALAAVPDEHQARMRGHAEFDDPLLDHAARGHKVELIGLEDVNGARAYHLQLTLASGDVEQRYLDAESFLDVRRTLRFKAKDGAEKTRTVTFSEWREVDGLKFNFASEGEVDGKRSKVTILGVEVDATIDPAQFKAPANVVAIAR